MSVLDNAVIDAISTSKTTNDVILTISDHLDWDDEFFHLDTLQKKINSYIAFVESGQIFDDYPNSINNKLIIQIVSKYDYNESGTKFLDIARTTLTSIGIDLIQRRL